MPPPGWGPQTGGDRALVLEAPDEGSANGRLVARSGRTEPPIPVLSQYSLEGLYEAWEGQQAPSGFRSSGAPRQRRRSRTRSEVRPQRRGIRRAWPSSWFRNRLAHSCTSPSPDSCRGRRGRPPTGRRSGRREPRGAVIWRYEGTRSRGKRLVPDLGLT
jgi:hypothetical protein